MQELSTSDIEVLHEALEDEYKAYSIYSQVISDFGEVRPFINIREAEGCHIAALVRLFQNYGLPIPDNTWPARVPRYTSLKAACEAAVQAEIDNGEMYEKLLSNTQQEDIIIVLQNLQEASQERHLPAFLRCAQGSGSPTCGGRGRGRGRQR